MKKKTLLSAALALITTAAMAQPGYNMKVTKNDGTSIVIPVKDVADVTFNTVENQEMTFKSGVGSFVHRDQQSNTAVYLLELSTNIFGDNTTMPMSKLYITLLGKADTVNIKQLSAPIGTFTIGDPNEPESSKFYPGVLNENGEAANTFLGTLNSAQDPMDIKLINGGTLTITPMENRKYTLEGNFTCVDGSTLKASYEGMLVIDNNSGEIAPADTLPLPESKLAADTTLVFGNKKYGMATDYGIGRFGIKNKTEVYLQLYTDDSYATCLDLYLLIDNEKYPGTKQIPAGKYPVLPKIDWENINSHELSAEPAWRVKTPEGSRVDLGCWFTWNYAYKAPLVGGEIEVLSGNTDSSELHLKFNLKDAKGHTVKGEWKGKIE